MAPKSRVRSCEAPRDSDGRADGAREPDPDKLLLAIQQALMFIGNTLANFNLERRLKAHSRLNLDLKVASGGRRCLQAAPYLFGPDFETKAKERLETVECLQKVSSTPCSKFFFWRQPFLPWQR